MPHTNESHVQMTTRPDPRTAYVDPVRRVLGEVKRKNADEGMSRAARLNEVCDRYALMIECSMPTLTVQEWCGLMDLQDGGVGVILGQSEIVAQVLAGSVAEGEEGEQTGTRWGYDTDALVDKIEAMSIASRMTMIEITDRFWSNSSEKQGVPLRDLLIACGASIHEEPPAAVNREREIT